MSTVSGAVKAPGALKTLEKTLRAAMGAVPPELYAPAAPLLGPEGGDASARALQKLEEGARGLMETDPGKGVAGFAGISEERRRALLESGAKGVTVNVTQVTPQVSATFGDIHETADAEELLAFIEEAAASALASQLMVGGR